MSYTAVLEAAAEKRIEKDVHYLEVQYRRAGAFRQTVDLIDAPKKRINWLRHLDYLRAESLKGTTHVDMAWHLSQVEEREVSPQTVTKMIVFYEIPRKGDDQYPLVG